MKRTKAALSLPVALTMSLALNPVIASAQTVPSEEENPVAAQSEPSEEVKEVSESAETSAAVEGLDVRLEITNPRQDGQQWKVGDEIRYELVVANDTGVNRAFETSGSNLDNWQPCKWTSMANGGELACNTLRHVVREDDLEAGRFVPTLDAKLFETPGYTGEFQDLEQIVGEEAIVAQAALDVDIDVDDSGDYAVGDTATAKLIVKNVGDAAVTVEVASEQEVGECEG